MRASVNGRVRVRSFDGASSSRMSVGREARGRVPDEGARGPRGQKKKLLEKAIAAAGRVSNIVTMTVIT